MRAAARRAAVCAIDAGASDVCECAVARARSPKRKRAQLCPCSVDARRDGPLSCGLQCDSNASFVYYGPQGWGSCSARRPRARRARTSGSGFESG